MGITANALQPINAIPAEYHADRKRIEPIRETLIAETGGVAAGYEKLVEEFTFTLFNRMAALKVMEAHTLHPEIITRRSQHGDRSFAHKHWLEEHTAGRNEEMEGLVSFVGDELSKLATDIPLFSPQHPYHLLPTAIEMNSIINAFNKVETDEQVEAEIWNSDDVLGWLYESYNNYKKAAHKDSGAKTEYNKVSIQSQVYTPRWVVKFLVDNSLGKQYLEMYPGSDIRNQYKIANAPKTQTREPKPLTEVKLIDPATGSGNFLLYAFDLFYDLYKDQIENYGGDYDEKKICELIIAHNLHGIDLDDRAVQIAQLGLYIKAKRKKRSAKVDHFNIVSSDFFLPDYEVVKDVFEAEGNLDERQKKVIRELWTDLQQAYKFGALIRIEEKLSLHTHALVKQFEGSLFSIVSNETLDEVEQFKASFFNNLHKAVALSTAKQGQTFLNTKTQDAITYLQVLTQKYDVAVANPPYTDSADFGKELKQFIEKGYKSGYNFHINLYASFIKRCLEFTLDDGYVGLIHPNTFMYIKTYEDVRKYIIDYTHIDLLVDYGLDRVNLFGPGVVLDAVWYILCKLKNDSDGIFFNIIANQQEKNKQSSLELAFNDLLAKKQNERICFLQQAKLKAIESWPFIYWISDGFRGKFKAGNLGESLKMCSGLGTGDNDRFMRFWWEVGLKNIRQNKDDLQKWVCIAKGGPYNKWYGNLWLVVNWDKNGESIKNFTGEDGKLRSTIRNEGYYFKEGMSFAKAGTKTPSFRYIPSNSIFDSSSPAIFTNKYQNLNYSIAYLNSSFAAYLLSCLNPTAGTQVGDLQRMPFVKPDKLVEKEVSDLAKNNIEIKKQISTFSLIEVNFEKSSLFRFSDLILKDRVLHYLNFRNALLSISLINEAIINDRIFDVFHLDASDIILVESKVGHSIGKLPLLDSAKKSFLNEVTIDNVVTQEYIHNLPVDSQVEQKFSSIKEGFSNLYQNNNNLEDFCIRNEINPINAWYWFKQNKTIPQATGEEIVLEFLADIFRELLLEDEDGIIPLTGLPGEPKLSDRFEQYCSMNGFSSSQIVQLENFIGRQLNEYIEQHFFRNFSNHLNLFPNVSKSPFIWHLSSGVNQGFEAYIIIYKWNSDSLYRLKSSYLSKRVESLNYRLQQIGDSNTAQAQTEKETIRRQLNEIDDFTGKIDELIAEGYNPKLDDGVGKNIAPLQKKGMLKAEVLNKKQLDKYLNADW